MNNDNIMNTDGYKVKLPPYFTGAHILLKLILVGRLISWNGEYQVRLIDKTIQLFHILFHTSLPYI